MASTDSYRHRDGILPGAVASAVAYESRGLPSGSHRGLPSPWITFIVSVDGPVRISGTVDEGDRFDRDRATAYDVLVAGLHPGAARRGAPAGAAGGAPPAHRGCPARRRPAVATVPGRWRAPVRRTPRAVAGVGARGGQPRSLQRAGSGRRGAAEPPSAPVLDGRGARTLTEADVETLPFSPRHR